MGQGTGKVSKTFEEPADEGASSVQSESQDASEQPVEVGSYLQDTESLETKHKLIPLSEKLEQNRSVDKSKIPFVFRWEFGGKDVSVCGTFTNWKTNIPLSKSQHGDFSTIIELPEGSHEYKFYVDGKWVHDPSSEITDNNLGSYNNVINVTKKDFEAYHNIDFIASAKQGLSSSPPGNYTQDIPLRSSVSGLPPHLPQLLQQTILNSDPPSYEDPTLLPEPNHVILNHLYALSVKDHVLVLAATQRYKEKYVTTILYRPV